MKTLVRALVALCLAIWLGGLIFFSFVQAPLTFINLADTHQAGTIVGASLRVLHWLGLGSGIALVLLLTTGGRIGLYAQQKTKLPLLTLLLMLALTALSQFGIIPRMEQYRLNAGGAVNRADRNDPARVAFNRLHKISEKVEGGVLLCGLAFVFLIARAESRQE
jgi:uncharacterized membrane protein